MDQTWQVWRCTSRAQQRVTALLNISHVDPCLSQDKLAYFRIKELKDILNQLGLPKQGKKQVSKCFALIFAVGHFVLPDM